MQQIQYFNAGGAPNMPRRSYTAAFCYSNYYGRNYSNLFKLTTYMFLVWKTNKHYMDILLATGMCAHMCDACFKFTFEWVILSYTTCLIQWHKKKENEE